VFESLTEKLQGALADVRRRGTLSEQDVDATLRTIRLALLEADVNLKVVRQFTAALRERCLGADVIGALNPGQQVVKIVAEELTSLMGGAQDGAPTGIAMSPTPPTVILMAGLQGSGKTTASAKLARYLRDERDAEVALAACDVYRPAAVDQLVKVGAQAGADVYEQGTDPDPVDVAAWALQRARDEHKDALIVDTSGRLHVDEAMMGELARMRAALQPHAVLLVVDAMTGQDAAGVAESFAASVDFDAVVITKLDGDARGGAALSVKALTGRPIAFASTGERLEQFERFHPARAGAQAAPQRVRLRRLPGPAADDQAHGPTDEPGGDDPGHGRAAEGTERGRTRAGPHRGDRALDDPGGAAPARADQGLAAPAHRARIGHDGAAGQRPGQAVRPDAPGDARRGPRQDARPGSADARRALKGRRARARAGAPTASGRRPRLQGRRAASKLPGGRQRARKEDVAVRLRLTRVGGKKDPLWRVVVADQRSPRDGRVIETIGHYNAQTEPSTIVLDEERARSWLARGAQPSSTVRKLLRIQGIEAGGS